MGASSDDLCFIVRHKGETKFFECWKWADKIVQDSKFGWHAGDPGDLDTLIERFDGMLFEGDGLPKDYGVVLIDFDEKIAMSRSDYGMFDRLGVSDVLGNLEMASLTGPQPVTFPGFRTDDAVEDAKMAVADLMESIRTSRMSWKLDRRDGWTPIDPASTEKDIRRVLEKNHGFLKMAAPAGWVVEDLLDVSHDEALSRIRTHLEKVGVEMPEWPKEEEQNTASFGA